MQARRKAFRVETMDRVTGRAIAHVNNGHQSSHHHDEIMSELRVLRSLVKPAEQVTQQMIDAYKAQITEAAKLKGELDLIQDAINKTKQEIATGARHRL
jgi:chemotaxis protein CheZ